MKTKRIWIWSFVFGIFASFIVYVLLFSNLSVGTSSSADEEKKKADAKTEQASTKSDKTIAERKKNNPMLPISKGKRAISLKVELEQGVSGYIEPGSYIDIIGYATTKDEQSKKSYKTAEIILQNKKVLTSGKSSDNEEEALHYETVTIEVTPKEGVMLGLAAKDKDGFYFMLRNLEDKNIEKKGIKQTREIYKEDNK